MDEWGIKYYQPRWTNSSDELTSLLLEASLKKEQVKSIWTAQDSEDGEWFKDAPVVICTQTKQLELCASHLDRFSFSINSIDLYSSIYWCGTKEDGELPLSWILADCPEIQDLIGKKIAEVGIIEYQMSDENQDFLSVDEWLLHGVAFYLQDRWFRVLNGLDCNRLDFKAELERSLRYTSIY